MPKRSNEWTWVPSRSWEWSEGTSTCGVHTSEGQLVWWSRPAGAGGYSCEAAREQSFGDYLANGAADFFPDEVEKELRQILRR